MALAAALVLVFGMGAYAGFPLVYDVFREALPGSAARDLGTEIGQQQSADGAKVTFEYAYADAGFVVVGYSVQDTREDRSSGGHPGQLSPLQIDDSNRTPDEEAAELPPRVDLTDETGQDFDLVQGSTTYSAADPGDLVQPGPNVAIFAPSEKLEPGEKHRFRLKVALAEEPIFPSDWEGEIEAPRDGWSRVGPFDFEVPVRRVPVVEVGQEETAKGITLTLKRVLNSPGKPRAIVCLESPNDAYEWRPSTAPTGFQTEEPLPVDGLGDGCSSLTIEDPVEGRSSVRVTEIFGYPRTERAAQEDEDGKQIEDPRTFEFTAPERWPWNWLRAPAGARRRPGNNPKHKRPEGEPGKADDAGPDARGRDGPRREPERCGRKRRASRQPGRGCGLWQPRRRRHLRGLRRRLPRLCGR